MLWAILVSSQSLPTSVLLVFLDLFERMLWTGRFSFKPVGGRGTILNPYDFNVHTHSSGGGDSSVVRAPDL